ETVIPLDPDPSLHVVNDWTENVPGTLLADGHRTGTCSVCDQPVNEVLKVEPTVVICTDATSAGYATEGVAFADILGDKHFYPTTAEPEGNDLLIEYSVLFNGTMLNLYDAEGSNPYVTARINGEPVLYWSPRNDITYSDAIFAGAFEWMGNFGTPISDSEVTTPATMCGVNPNYSDYPNVGGADQNNPEYGWHRIQIRVHQELIDEAALKAEAAGTAAGVKDYVAVATVYVDGTAAFKLSTGTKGLQKIQDNLFTAEADGNGGITYTDGNASVIAFYLNRTRAVLDKVAYVAVADINVTCGKEFVQKDLSKVAYPAPKTLVVDEDAGVEIDAPMYYTVACEGEHEWDDEWVTYVAPTLLSDGVEAQHCTKCGQSQSRVAAYEPIVYLSSWDDETKNDMPYTANDEDYKTKPKPSFDIKTSVQSVRAGDTFAPTEENENGKDLFVEFSFLYNETQQNLKSGGDSEVLTVMYIENYNIFNINLKTGKIASRPRTGDVILFKADPSGEIAIGDSVTVDYEGGEELTFRKSE
ncbi:MAG: hypothetical protein J6X72_03630, partial [Clostridia bacterium]|nr:hypothetical protein [Clostridia bacterium]